MTSDNLSCARVVIVIRCEELTTPTCYYYLTMTSDNFSRAGEAKAIVVSCEELTT